MEEVLEVDVARGIMTLVKTEWWSAQLMKG